jgi:hypothetical protein
MRGVGGELQDLASELMARAGEIQSAAALLGAVAEALTKGAATEAASREVAAAILGIGRGDGSSGPRARVQGARGPAGGAPVAAGAVFRRLWDQTPLVLVEAATVHSFGQVGLGCVGIDGEGHKHVLGLEWQATSSQHGPAVGFVEDLYGRGVHASDAHHLLFVTDGGLALDQAIAKRYPGARVALCHAAFSARVLGHVRHTPEESQIRSELRRALAKTDADDMRRHLERLGQSLSLSHPGAALAVREGLSGALVLPGLGLPAALYRSLATVAVLRTAIAEAVRLGRSRGATEEGKDALALGVEGWERRTRRVIGYEGLGALSMALGSPSRVA